MGSDTVTDLPEGFVLEKDLPKAPKTIAPPEGFVLEGEAAPTERAPDMPGFASNPSLDQGLSFGFSDELAGLARAAVLRINEPDLLNKIGEAYRSGRADELARVKQFEEESPVLSTVSEVAGGLTSGGALRPAAAAVSKMGQMFQRLPEWLKSTGLGALWGGLYGAGTAEEDQRLKGAGTGAAAGALTGGIVHGVTQGVRAGVRKSAGYVNALRDPEGQAVRVLGEKVRADETTPARLRARLRELGPQATIADAGGENVLGLTRGVAGQPGPAKNRVMQTLEGRAQGEAGRVSKQVEKNLGPGDFFAAEDVLLNKLSEGAKDAYSAAYQKNPSIMTKTLDKILSAKPARDALGEAAFIVNVERAAGRAANLGPVDKELTELARYAADLGKMERPGREGVAKGFSLETWDYVKRGLDSLLDKPAYRNELTGKLNKKGAAVNDLRKALVRALDNATGGEKSLYAGARKQYGDTAEQIGALKDGANFFKLAPEQILKRIDNLSEAGKAAYRNGAARAVLDIVEKTPDGASAATRLFNKSINRSKIRAVFPDDGKFHDFARRMVAEQRFAKTKNAIGAGSRTAPMTEEIRDAQDKIGSIGAVVGSMIPGGGHALVKAKVGRRLLQGVLGTPEEMNKALARMLTTRNQAEQLRILDMLTPFAKQSSSMHPALRAAILGISQREAEALSGLYGNNQPAIAKTLADVEREADPTREQRANRLLPP